MSLHPDLAKLLPLDMQDIFARGYHTRFNAAELTAFALAVARAERERCIDHLDAEARRGNNYTILSGAPLRALPDPTFTKEAP